MTITVYQMRAWEADIEYWRDKWRAQKAEIERLERRFNEVCDLLDRAEGNIVRQEQEIERLRGLLSFAEKVMKAKDDEIARREGSADGP